MNDNKKKIILYVIIGVLVILLCLLFAKFLSTPKEDNSIHNLVIDTSAENIQRSNDALASRQIHFPGIADGALDKSAPLVLSNPASNEDIYLQYTIVNDATGDVLFETDLIESSQAVSWVPGDILAPGDYSLTLIEQPYYKAEGSDGWLPLTTGNNHVNIKIVEVESTQEAETEEVNEIDPVEQGTN